MAGLLPLFWAASARAGDMCGVITKPLGWYAAKRVALFGEQCPGWTVHAYSFSDDRIFNSPQILDRADIDENEPTKYDGDLTADAEEFFDPPPALDASLPHQLQRLKPVALPPDVDQRLSAACAYPRAACSVDLGSVGTIECAMNRKTTRWKTTCHLQLGAEHEDFVATKTRGPFEVRAFSAPDDDKRLFVIISLGVEDHGSLREDHLLVIPPPSRVETLDKQRFAARCLPPSLRARFVKLPSERLCAVECERQEREKMRTRLDYTECTKQQCR